MGNIISGFGMVSRNPLGYDCVEKFGLLMITIVGFSRQPRSLANVTIIATKVGSSKRFTA